MPATTEQLIGLLRGDDDSCGYCSSHLVLEICRSIHPRDLKNLLYRCYGTYEESGIDPEILPLLRTVYEFWAKLEDKKK